MITSLQQLDLEGNYTYTDYIVWQFQERVELLRGRLFPMAAPNVKHQKISSELHGYLWFFFKEQHCHVFTAPFDVRLPLPTHKATGKKIDTVVQPDLCVVCDENKLDAQGCVGAPDLVVEILSPGNSKKEMVNKYELYEASGVREYWIFNPEHNFVLTYHLDESVQKFVSASRPLVDDEVLVSKVFPALSIDLSKVFPKN